MYFSICLRYQVSKIEIDIIEIIHQVMEDIEIMEAVAVVIQEDLVVDTLVEDTLVEDIPVVEDTQVEEEAQENFSSRNTTFILKLN